MILREDCFCSYVNDSERLPVCEHSVYLTLLPYICYGTYKNGLSGGTIGLIFGGMSSLICPLIAFPPEELGMTSNELTPVSYNKDPLYMYNCKRIVG